jgi:2-polyprenyl-6-methoxyphenol hydroxylase-like FAD-dependent oxidoreductase
MPAVVIVGAGIGGLAAALLLGREGRDVVVCERDAAPVPATTEEMWSAWSRPGIPQAPLGHTFLPGFRALLAARAPDVLERVHAAGAPLVDFARDMPGADRRPEDGDLQAIMCRRAVLEGILRQTVAAEPTVQIRTGCDVTGLAATSSRMPGVPRVVGVHTRGGGTFAADTVVVAGGRLVPVPRWLRAIGVQAPEELAEGCGFVTFTRFFRIHPRPGEDHRVSTHLTVEGDQGFMSYEIFGADSSTFCVELTPPASDHALRGLRHEAVHMAAARLLPEIEDWLDPGRATPIGPVAAMGQERNVLRHFVADGRPVALGLHVIGDARCQLDSLYAWGSGVALAGAVALVDVLAAHRDDPEAQALAFEHRMGAEIGGRHALSLARDRATARRYRGQPEWDEPEHGIGLLQSTVVPAAAEDADVYRAVTRWENQLDPVDALLKNTAIIERARALAAVRAPQPPTTSGPTRERLLELIAAPPAW